MHGKTCDGGWHERFFLLLLLKLGEYELELRTNWRWYYIALKPVAKQLFSSATEKTMCNSFKYDAGCCRLVMVAMNALNTER